MKVEVLTCDLGLHTWTRPLTKGKKPRLCPVHKGNAVEVVRVVRDPEDVGSRTKGLWVYLSNRDVDWLREKLEGDMSDHALRIKGELC